MSYSRDFLICIKFCETMVIVLDPPACFARLVCILSGSIRNVYKLTENGSPLVLPFNIHANPKTLKSGRHFYESTFI